MRRLNAILMAYALTHTYPMQLRVIMTRALDPYRLHTGSDNSEDRANRERRNRVVKHHPNPCEIRTKDDRSFHAVFKIYTAIILRMC